MRWKIWAGVSRKKRPECQSCRENVFNLISAQRNANEDYRKSPFHTNQLRNGRRLVNPNPGVQQQSLSHQKGRSETALGNILVPSQEVEGARTSSSSESASRISRAGVSKDLRKGSQKPHCANRKPEVINSHEECNCGITIHQRTVHEWQQSRMSTWASVRTWHWLGQQPGGSFLQS